VQRALESTIGDAHGEDLPAARQGAEIRYRPVQPDQSQHALDETRRLPERHAEEHFHRQARLDSSIIVSRVSPALTGGRGLPAHLGIKPNRQRPSALGRVVICRPVRSFVAGECRSAHASQLPRWSQKMNPPACFVQQSRADCTVSHEWLDQYIMRTHRGGLGSGHSIELSIDHTKNDSCLTHCAPTGVPGDVLHAVLCGRGHNIRMILGHFRDAAPQSAMCSPPQSGRTSIMLGLNRASMCSP
jgi:hypothetical protein